MRLIGHVPTEANAATFSDFLCVEGITSAVEQDMEGWAIWIHSEDELQKAKDFLMAFLANPRDARFAGKSGRAKQLRQQVAAEAEKVEERTFDRKAVFRATMSYSVGPLTMVLALVCAGIAVMSWAGYRDRVLADLCISRITPVDDTHVRFVIGLSEIRSGEFWRLITPALVHTQFLHLAFNLLLLFDLGSMIEARHGTVRLGLMVVLFAVASNVAQYFADGPAFWGFSGVNYGLFGYIWARGRLDPSSGLFMHPHSVAMLVIWFFLCLANVVPNVANMAHAAGMGLGLLLGFITSLPVMRRSGT